MTRVAAVAPAFPPHVYDQQTLTDAFAEVVLPPGGDRRLLDRLHAAAAVRTRHLAFGDVAAVWGMLQRLRVAETIDAVVGDRRSDAAASAALHPWRCFLAGARTISRRAAFRWQLRVSIP